MYTKPTREQIENGLEWGWREEDCVRGYTMFDYDGTGCIDIEMINDMELDFTDEDAAVHAQNNGYCKIIPVSELPVGLPESMKFYGWVDTEENRQRLNLIGGKYESL